MNKAKYFLVNNENIVAIVYESDKYGRTIVFRAKIDPDCEIKLLEVSGNKVADIDFVDFIQSMIPQ